MNIIEQYREERDLLAKWEIYHSMTNEEKLKYHLEEFRKKPEWRRMQDERLLLKPFYTKWGEVIYKIKWFFLYIWLKTKLGRRWQKKRHLKFWKQVIGN